MKKRMSELEAQIALQSENMNKISINSNQKEEKLNHDITEYINQINDLKNEMEVLNNIITNLTEEKENNAIKITNLLHENEKLKQNMKNNNKPGDTINTKSTENSNNNNKKYEEIIFKLKKNMLNLKEENKALEEVIFKQESEVTQLSSKVIEVENLLIKKDKELQESIEYSAKLTSSINFHKNEINKIKQKQNDNNKIDKNSETIYNLEKDLQNLKKNLETKENKLNILSVNNKSLQDKLNKLTQEIKNELNCYNGIISKVSNKNKNSIYSSYNNYHTNKVTICKPQSQLKNKTTRISGAINPIASNILPKNNNIINNIENYKDNHKNIQMDKSPTGNRQNIDDKKLYIVSKHKIKSKTPGKLISSKHKLVEPKNGELDRPNIEILNKKNGKKVDINLDNICPNINVISKNMKNSKLNINEKYKQIESKYKNDKKEMTKEDTLFNEEDINNLNIKKEIITPTLEIDEDIDGVPIFNNMNSQILKSIKEGRKPGINKKNLAEQSIVSQDKEFPIIESYCMIMDKDNQNKSNYITNENNNSKNLTINNNRDKINESKLEAKQIQDLKDHVNKILNNF